MANEVCSKRLPLRVGGLCAAAAFCAALAFAGTGVVLAPTSAQADAQATLAEVRQLVSERSMEYAQAMEATEEARAQVEDCQARIAQLEAQIPAAQDTAATAMVTQYKYSQNGAGLLDIILSANGFETFISMVSYLNAVEESTETQLRELLALQEQLNAERANLEVYLAEAQAREDEAAELLYEAQVAAEIAEQRAAEEEAARQAAIAAAQAAAAAEAAAAQSSIVTSVDEQTGETVYYQEQQDGSLEQVDAEYAEQVIEEEAESAAETYVPEEVSYSGGGEVSSWAARIDAYLAGSPLEGYGYVFAEAALANGVDPRWSPAISMIESTQGRYCFRSYNAWGWMGHSFSSWEEAIREHVAYLGYMYGGQLTWEAANIYCDPGDEWYYAVKAEMECI